MSLRFRYSANMPCSPHLLLAEKESDRLSIPLASYHRRLRLSDCIVKCRLANEQPIIQVPFAIIEVPLTQMPNSLARRPNHIRLNDLPVLATPSRQEKIIQFPPWLGNGFSLLINCISQEEL